MTLHSVLRNAQMALRLALSKAALRPAALRVATRSLADAPKPLPSGVIPDNDEMSTGMEKKEILNTPDIFWSREPIMGPKGTKENPAIIPSFNSSRCVGLETEQGVIWFRLEKGPLHLVADQYFKLEQIDGGDH